ncbi:MAG: HAD-IIIC family phosphatase [Acidobacteria bacterium]|nr:HAD-IIIC family phosphatase [Acidobacteriota bacterium]
MLTQSDFQKEIDALLSQGEQYLAWTKLRNRLWEEPSLPLFHGMAKFADQLDPEAVDLRRARVALLGSFTLDPLVPVLKAHALASRIVATVHVGGFNAWQQEGLAEASRLYEFKPDVIILALRAEDLVLSLVQGFTQLSAVEIKTQVAEATASLETFLTAVRQRTDAKLLVHSLVPPVFPAFGILDHHLPSGQARVFRELNEVWANAAKRTGNTWIVDCERLVSEVGWGQWQDARMWAFAKMPLSTSAMGRLAEEYARYLRAFLGLAKKVLVLDLDNTLWGGVVGEDGFNGIQLGTEHPGSAFVELQRAILDLHGRGVILAINSKNNQADAQEVIDKHPGMVLRAEHFAATRINWNDKAGNLEELAGELNLGLDSFVFVDDSLVECERIRQAVPQVLTIHLANEPEKRADRIRRLGLFDTLSYSSEDQKRTQMYRAEGARKQLRNQLHSLEDYYLSLDMELTIQSLTDMTLPRAAQLTQRTNQFNLTTRRYSESQLASFVQSGECEIYTARLRDRFGDDGIIGLTILRRRENALSIDTFLMSCRVIARGVEAALLTFILKRAGLLGVGEVVGEYRPTKKNEVTADFYPKQGFQQVSTSQDGTMWRIESSEFGRAYPSWIRVGEGTA